MGFFDRLRKKPAPREEEPPPPDDEDTHDFEVHTNTPVGTFDPHSNAFQEGKTTLCPACGVDFTRYDSVMRPDGSYEVCGFIDHHCTARGGFRPRENSWRRI